MEEGSAVAGTESLRAESVWLRGENNPKDTGLGSAAAINNIMSWKGELEEI